EDEPDELVFDLFEREIFGKHPLSRTIIGTPQTVNRFTRQKLATFHRKHYRASDITIVASGSHSHEALFKAVDRAIKHVAPHIHRRLLSPTRFPRISDVEHEISRASGQQAHLILGRRAPGMDSKRHLAISALVTLGGA